MFSNSGHLKKGGQKKERHQRTRLTCLGQFRPQLLAEVCMLMGQELITLFIIAEMYLMDKWITDAR